MHRNDLKVKITRVENVLKMRKIYLYDKDLTDGMREICWKVPRHELVLVNGLEKPVVTHGTVLRTHKDEGLGANETDAEHILRTLEVPPNGYEAAE